MTTTHHEETERRAERVMAYLHQHGPSHSMQIVAGTGLSKAAVIGSLTGLRRAGEVVMTDQGRAGKSHYVWSLGTPKTAPHGADPFISGEDRAWQQFWFGRYLERQRRAIRLRGAL